MKIVIQRTLEASVTIEGEKVALIEKGLLVLCIMEKMKKLKTGRNTIFNRLSTQMNQQALLYVHD